MTRRYLAPDRDEDLEMPFDVACEATIGRHFSFMMQL